jgi:hypothetical protein
VLSPSPFCHIYLSAKFQTVEFSYQMPVFAEDPFGTCFELLHAKGFSLHTVQSPDKELIGFQGSFN